MLKNIKMLWMFLYFLALHWQIVISINLKLIIIVDTKIMFVFIDHRKIRIIVYFSVMNTYPFYSPIFDANENLFSGNEGQNA